MRTFHILLAFCLGLFIGYLFFDNHIGIRTSLSKVGQAAIVSLQHIDTTKVKTESGLHKRNTLLEGQLLLLNSQLKKSRARLTKERQKVKAIQVQLLNDTISCKDSTLQQHLFLQIDALNTATDSLVSNYEFKIHIIESSVAVRDSELIVCNRAYRDVQSLAQQQIARERQLTKDLNKILKQQKKKRIHNRILTVGMVFISGFTASLIIKSKQ